MRGSHKLWAKPMSNIIYKPPKLKERIILFRSYEQFYQYSVFMIPFFSILIIINLSSNMDSILPLYLALIGSSASLIAVVPAQLYINKNYYSRISPLIRDWLETQGYIEEDNGKYIHKWRVNKYKKILIYPENSFKIEIKCNEVVINGPNWQIKKLKKYLNKKN